MKKNRSMDKKKFYLMCVPFLVGVFLYLLSLVVAFVISWFDKHSAKHWYLFDTSSETWKGVYIFYIILFILITLFFMALVNEEDDEIFG